MFDWCCGLFGNKKEYKQIEDKEMKSEETSISKPVEIDPKNYGTSSKSGLGNLNFTMPKPKYEKGKRPEYAADDDLRVSDDPSSDSGYSADLDEWENETPWNSDDNVTSDEEDEDKKKFVEIKI